MTHAAPPIWLRRLTLAALLAYWLLIFTLTHLPPADVPHVPVSDKLEHAAAFGAFGGLLYATLWTRNPRRRYLALTVIAIAMLYGAVDENTQPFFGRACELGDWIADVTAVTVATAGMSLARWWWERTVKVRNDAAVVTPP